MMHLEQIDGIRSQTVQIIRVAAAVNALMTIKEMILHVKMLTNAKQIHVAKTASENGSCNPIENPCKSGNHDFDINSEHITTKDSITGIIDGFKCNCKVGFEDNEFSMCDDIDECETDLHNCSD